MRRIIFESPAEYIILCVLVAVGFAMMQYFRLKQPWSRTMNRILFLIRTVLVFFLALLLVGPIVKQVQHLFEKPVFVVLIDDSASVKAATDSVTLRKLRQNIAEIRKVLEEKGFETALRNLAGEEVLSEFLATTSDIDGALKRVSHRFEDGNLAGVILASDGIYNHGISPLYTRYNFPVYTIGVGDTVQRPDIAIKNIAYNKIVYQGNKFPLRTEVQVKNLDAQNVTVSLFKRGKLLERKTQKTSRDDLVTFDFQPEAEEEGIQKLDIRVEVNPEESNTQNNQASVFIEVVKGKKKILMVAAAPHPDIKALREGVEKNPNYEFILHIPGVVDAKPDNLKPENADLVIFHQVPDRQGRTRALFRTFIQSKTPYFVILGQQSDLHELSSQKTPVWFRSTPRDYDEVTPVVNHVFGNFSLSEEIHSIISGYPPVSVPFSNQLAPASAVSLLFQRIGSVSTEKPLLITDASDGRKTAVMFGEGLWRWRLNEYERTEDTEAFDELFGKLIQFLSTSEDKRKFRSYPIQQEFTDTEPVVFESQVYNDIYEPVFGNTIEISIIDDQGEQNGYTYVTSPGNTRYQIGGLKEGVYHYRAKTTINQQVEQVEGEFAVIRHQSELRNLTADFDLLRRLSANTGGKFFLAEESNKLSEVLRQTTAESIIHTEETYTSIINLKIVFWLLLLLVSGEWFLRKYHGSY